MDTNAGIKPSLAAYSMRPDSCALAQRYRNEAPLQQAAGKDEALLALVDSQTETAHKRLREGHAKQAIELLRRAHQAAVTFVAPSPKGETPLVVRLASAIVRLQLCAALSLLDRHHQAMEEAVLAKNELDSVWMTMSNANIEAQALNVTGEILNLDAALLSHLKHPPSWLGRAFETAITARMCQAVELEFMVPAEELQIALNASLSAQFPSHQPFADKLQLDAIGMPKSEFSGAEELADLHRQAKHMCKMLLPHQSVTRIETEKHITMAHRRWKDVLGISELPSPSISSRSSPAMSKTWSAPSIHPSSLPPLNSQPKWTRPQRPAGFHDSMIPKTASKDSLGSTCAGSSSEPWLDASLDSMRSMDSHLSELTSHSEFVRTATPGDVMYRTLPASFSEAKRAKKGTRPRSKERARSNKASKESMDAVTEVEDPNPFREWKKNFNDKGKMSYFERELQTLEGIKRLQKDMKPETARFKQWLTDLERLGEENRLADDRILYCDHGVKALKIGEKIKKDWEKNNLVKEKSERVLELQAKKKELWSFYGVGIKEKDKGRVDVKSLKKLMQASIDWMPEEKKRKEAEEKIKEQEELQKNRSSLMTTLGAGFSKHKGSNLPQSDWDANASGRRESAGTVQKDSKSRSRR